MRKACITHGTGAISMTSGSTGGLKNTMVLKMSLNRDGEKMSLSLQKHRDRLILKTDFTFVAQVYKGSVVK